MFPFHTFPSVWSLMSSLNDAAFHILNDVLKIFVLIGSLLFNGFSVFDDFLVSVIISSVLSDRWHCMVIYMLLKLPGQ